MAAVLLLPQPLDASQSNTSSYLLPNNFYYYLLFIYFSTQSMMVKVDAARARAHNRTFYRRRVIPMMAGRRRAVNSFHHQNVTLKLFCYHAPPKNNTRDGGPRCRSSISVVLCSRTRSRRDATQHLWFRSRLSPPSRLPRRQPFGRRLRRDYPAPEANLLIRTIDLLAQHAEASSSDGGQRDTVRAVPRFGRTVTLWGLSDLRPHRARARADLPAYRGAEF